MATIKLDTLATVHYMQESKANAENFDSVRRGLYSLGIKSSYDKKKMIFSTLHTHKNQLANIYAQECNGLILELGTWKPLMVPPRSLRFNIVTEASNGFLHQGLYHIYKAQDGTCFNLYYYEDKWIISTAKGYEMNEIKWDGKTYQELISECLAKLPNMLTWETFTNTLDKTRCYSLGFKPPNFHHFFEGTNQPVYKLWFIQSVNLNTESDTYLWASDKSPIDQISCQEYYTAPVGNLKELYRIATDSLDTFISTGSVCYGFILRSVNFETTGFHSDLFIESSLMRTIRKFWYENSVVDLCHSLSWSKEIAITLNAYLDSSSYETFMYLFPQYQDKFISYSSVIRQIVQTMMDLTSTSRVVDNKDLSDANNLVPAIVSLETIAAHLIELFKDSTKYELTSKTAEQKKRVFTEFTVHPSNLELIMKLF